MKNKVLFIFYLCCIILSSCQKGNQTLENEQNKNESLNKTEEANDDSRMEEETAFRDDFPYEEINVKDVFKIYGCKMTRHEIGDLIDIEISYPQISYDIDTAAVINSKIYEKAVKEEMTKWHDSRLNYYLDYELTYFNTDLISILFKSDNECFGVNYDLKTGEIIEIEQYISTDIIRELLKTEKNSFYEEVLKKAIEKVNFDDDFTDFFIWEKGIGLIVWPTEGGGKDYFIIYINLEEKKVVWEI